MSFLAYWDGGRAVSFMGAADVQTKYPLSRSDSAKETVERVLDAPIDWWPLSHGRRSCPKGHMRVFWKVCLRSCATHAVAEVPLVVRKAAAHGPVWTLGRRVQERMCTLVERTKSVCHSFQNQP